MSASAVAVRLAPRRERDEAVDILRGVALFGVLVVNLLTGFRLSLFAYYFGGYVAPTPLDHVVDVAVGAVLEMKSFIVFSLLFGVGLALQSEHLGERDGRFVALAARRLGVLLAIGLVHFLLIWDGDILVEYAVVGLLALALIRASNEVRATSAVLAFGIYASGVSGHVGGSMGGWLSGEALTRHVAAANHAYGNGRYFDALTFRLYEAPYIATLLVDVLPRTFALLLLGAMAERAGFVTRPEAHQRSLALIGWGGICVGGMGTLALHFASPSAFLEKCFTTSLGIGYAAALFRLLQRARLKSALSFLAPVGRMALTNYLTQSVVWTLVFNGYGLGLFHRVGSAAALVMGVALYVAQVALSHGWLACFRFGPMEWVWRSMTYGQWQPMRRR